VSEYQYVAFRAIDHPVSEKNLDYMHRQSSRAEITPWSFENEYHFGDFRGNAIEMLRRGYDLHLHYANFGIRNLLIRLPQGLPDPKSFQSYAVKNSLEFSKDKQGQGGCLSIEPYYEPGDLEELWEIDTLLDLLVPLRAEILDGDLRPLYLAHLAVVRDCNHDPGEMVQAPVPAGLGDLSKAQRALAELYGLSEALIAAAAQESLPVPDGSSSQPDYEEWIRHQSEESKNAWLTSLMNDPASPVRAELVASYRNELSLPKWPTSKSNRTITQLETAATEIAQKTRQRAAAKAARQRERRLAKMAANPTATLRETERLVAQRSTDAYRQVAELLAELREALVESGQSDLAEKQAQKLKAKNPKLNRLTSELRRQGFMPK